LAKFLYHIYHPDVIKPSVLDVHATVAKRFPSIGKCNPSLAMSLFFYYRVHLYPGRFSMTKLNTKLSCAFYLQFKTLSGSIRMAYIESTKWSCVLEHHCAYYYYCIIILSSSSSVLFVQYNTMKTITRQCNFRV